MEKEDQRNFMIAMFLMIAFVWAYQTFIIDPEVQARKAAEAAQREQVATTTTPSVVAPETTPTIQRAETVEAALGQAQRVAFDSQQVRGSIRVKGARIDDLLLKDEFETVERKDPIRLFRPAEGPNGYYAAYGWRGADGIVAGINTDWEIIGDGNLSANNPLRLRHVGGGLSIERQISVDDHYMFTFEDTVTNTSSAAQDLNAFGVIRRYGEDKDFLKATDPEGNLNSALVHQGLIGVLDGSLKLRKYKPLSKGKIMKGANDRGEIESTEGGWLGLTDKYWMGALIPQQDMTFNGYSVREMKESGPELRLHTRSVTLTLAPGETRTVTNRVFAGAKRLDQLKEYKKTLGIPRFDDAIDWGFLYFLTKPFFSIIVWLNSVLGSFGLAILGFTVLVKAVLFPLYNTSYKSMAKMKKLTEPMKEIRERFAADRQRQQQEIMKLYKEHNANPVAGCVPILATIPVFYALYKTLFVTIEMRHESFLWLNDLSAPDPTALLNGFGLFGGLVSAATLKGIPVVGIILGIGALPLLYGITMWAMQSLNPPPEDPNQARIMMFLPIVFTFVFAGFAGGLVLYFVWNNLLTLAQQYTIMRRQGVETGLDKLIARIRGGKTGEST